jgi:hypothetical protein
MACSRYGRYAPTAHGAVGRRDAHAGERGRAGGVEALEDAEPVEDPRRLRAEVLAAGLRPRARATLEDERVHAALREQDPRGGAGRAGPDDDDVRMAGPHAVSATTRAMAG